MDRNLFTNSYQIDLNENDSAKINTSPDMSTDRVNKNNKNNQNKNLERNMDNGIR